MKLVCTLVLILWAQLSFAQLAPQVPETQIVQCELTFLQANDQIFKVPAGVQTTSVSLKMIDPTPFYQKWGGSWSQKVAYSTNKEFTLKTYFTVMANGSLWFMESKYRLQIFSILLDQQGQVVSVVRDNTDRIVRDYQREEIEKGHPTLRLAIPMPLDWSVIYKNPTTLAVAEEQGPEAAFKKALQMDLISRDVVKEMGVLCSLN